MTEGFSPAFGAAAGGALVPVAGKVEEVRDQAATGGLRIDLTAAETMLRQLADLRRRAADLVKDGASLDTPLRFGDNWVGRIMSQRLRAVAVGEDGGVTPVLGRFHELLDAVESIIRLAAARYQTTDQQATDELHRASGRLDTGE
ncbi:hypothetical protein [Actinophytocola sp.]|uniref:hypothetical protein n=1 Tax=Actinophytocola sp. TaxID=1872138 RepID=UPI003D6C0080